MPYNAKDFAMVTSPSGNGVVVIGIGIGNIIGRKFYNKIFELKNNTMKWMELKQTLTYERTGHIAIPIPDSFELKYRKSEKSSLEEENKKPGQSIRIQSSIKRISLNNSYNNKKQYQIFDKYKSNNYPTGAAIQNGKWRTGKQIAYQHKQLAKHSKNDSRKAKNDLDRRFSYNTKKEGKYKIYNKYFNDDNGYFINSKKHGRKGSRDDEDRGRYGHRGHNRI